jgi:hypothetical protein
LFYLSFINDIYHRYKKRCHKALVAQTMPNPNIMSIIIDGMAQGKCLIPYAGRQNQYSYSLQQHITGVKEHGVGLTLYRTIETVSKGANLTIYCILDRIEAFYRRHSYYPETLYLQVDGGSENANKYVLGVLELLVVKRICKDIWYSRLPTGHTHEDIDGCFGTIWSALCSEPLLTMDDWKDKVLKTFDQTTLKASVKDIWVIPDFCKVIEPCIIRDLGQMHRDLKTQHQWRFRAVERCHFFPYGCKATFRAYSSDCVIEFIRKPRLNCLSEVGRYTGLEPTKLFCRWFPSSECNPTSRPGVEGMFILENLPSFQLLPGSIVPGPCAIPDGAIQAMVACLREIRSRFHIVEDNIVRRWWTQWETIYVPKTSCSISYIAQLRENNVPYHVPLQSLLLNAGSYLSLSTNGVTINDYADYDPDFQWPEVFSRATNSVESALFNPFPPPPREYATSDLGFQDRISVWNCKSASYYF